MRIRSILHTRPRNTVIMGTMITDTMTMETANITSTTILGKTT